MGSDVHNPYEPGSSGSPSKMGQMLEYSLCGEKAGRLLHMSHKALIQHLPAVPGYFLVCFPDHWALGVGPP